MIVGLILLLVHLAMPVFCAASGSATAGHHLVAGAAGVPCHTSLSVWFGKPALQ
jgi:hypothetical protein